MSIDILLVEDEQDQRDLIESILTAEGYKVTAISNAEGAIQLIEKTRYDVIISDWKLPGMNGEELLNEIIKISPDSGFILITAHSDASHAINIIRAGADEYLPKPFDKKSLLFALSKLIYLRQIESENKQLKQESNHRTKLIDMIGVSKSMNKLFYRIEKAAPTSATLLITGESGTGKELAAKAIHQLSGRKDNIFLPVNCAAIPETLAEAELFGAEKGSYTGANKTRIGKLEAAAGGTIFLDEIGELPLVLQSKLLRFLQEGTVSRVGSNDEIKLDVRVLAATNRSLKEEVKAGNFREDLFYRLNVIPVDIPPLRQRQDDLPILISHFVKHFCQQHNIDLKRLSSSGLKLLNAFSWPGNVRQLRNCIERLVLLSHGDIISAGDVEDLDLTLEREPVNFLIPEQGIDWQEHEKSCLIQALDHSNNNRTQAAKLLGLNYKAFLYRLEKYQID